ncbi:hypothetical protein SCHPADRAFT_545216 [Schizopora paradoxa]|uniref:LysM domain-containing protein n=1 Tax=Schizopora paradoxa TaxID=27342 RepID=A0A0H2RDC1_9AGAM|nr:hypothetical protein SCHPADRAFT_545216 [Schizopora paradoxa]
MELDLCIACCGSLPPSAREQAQIFRTRCCNKAICPKCLSSNPRLSRYHPCLSCLAGVRAVAGSSRSGTMSKGRGASDLKAPSDNVERFNLDGSLKNEDLFTLGDDDDDEESEKDGEEPGDVVVEEQGNRGGGSSSRASSPPPAYRPDQPTSVQTQDSPEILFDVSMPDEKMDEVVTEAAKRHYIQKSETLLGIAFKYKIDGRTLCRLNNLPMSTLSTTPHLLHTRTFLVLPYDTKVSTNQSHLTSISVPDQMDSAVAREHAKKRTLERAAKRFQIVTKEEDWRIANAYVALAASDASSSGSRTSAAAPVLDKEEKEWRSRQRHDDDNGGDMTKEKRLSGGVAPLTTRVAPSSRSSALLREDEDRDVDGNGKKLRVEAMALAVDAYLDDVDWEERERARGRGPSSRLGRENTSRRAGGRSFSSWFGAWTPEKAL